MFEIRMRVKRYATDVFDPDHIMARMERQAQLYALDVGQEYMNIVADWSDEHGRHDASPRLKSHYPQTRINIYMRGKAAYIFAWQDMGFLRKIALIGGVGGSPKVGSGGNLVTGRLLRTPKPVAARHYTKKIVEAARSGTLESGSYAEFMRRGLIGLRKTGSWKVYK